jgi:clan AA aspartic protease
MGTVRVTIAVGDPQGQAFEDLEVTVDTGSTFTAVPRELLQRLGVPVQDTAPAELADGSTQTVEIGETLIRLQGRQFHTQVIFAGKGEPSLLGVVTLEEARLAVDPIAQRLVPTNLLRF